MLAVQYDQPFGLKLTSLTFKTVSDYKIWPLDLEFVLNVEHV